MKRRSRFFAAALLSALAALTLAGAAAADPPQLTGQRTSSNFYPCTDPQDATPPTLADCVGALPLDVVVSGTCNPAGNSTMTLIATGSAFGAPPLFNGSYEETITWTIGPQTNPAVPFFVPFLGGPGAESVGLLTGEVTSLTSSFEIAAGGTTITGTKSLVPNAGNWGVCLQPTDEPIGGNFGGAPLNGEIYILGAGVLSYEATIDDGSPTTESGLAESYMMNSYLTCCPPGPPSQVNSAAGHFESGFGTTHPASGTSGQAPTTGPGTVEPLPEVEITFGAVNTPGTTTAVLTTSVPPLPAGFQVGVPPAFYEISTTADVVFPVTVCIGFGALPAGTTEPTLFHYEGGWVDVTTSFTFSPNKVCGSVDSLSPFAVAFEEGPAYALTGPFEPVNTGIIVNTAKAGQTIPVKFSLGGDFGLDVFADGYPKFVGEVCDPDDPSDPIEMTSNGAGLTYDATTGQYTYHWKTLKAWAGHCGTLTVQFNDGSSFQANFKFK